jgi:hypothetical protein
MKGEMQWISVKDRLPEIGDAVLTCNTGGISSDEREPLIGFIEEKDKKWYRPWVVPSQELTPTHWMPFPDPPEVK